MLSINYSLTSNRFLLFIFCHVLKPASLPCTAGHKHRQAAFFLSTQEQKEGEYIDSSAHVSGSLK